MFASVCFCVTVLYLCIPACARHRVSCPSQPISPHPPPPLQTPSPMPLGEPQLATAFFNMVRGWVVELRTLVHTTQEVNKASMNQVSSLVSFVGVDSFIFPLFFGLSEVFLFWLFWLVLDCVVLVWVFYSPSISPLLSPSSSLPPLPSSDSNDCRAIHHRFAAQSQEQQVPHTTLHLH
jgi:hypothetical protein